MYNERNVKVQWNLNGTMDLNSISPAGSPFILPFSQLRLLIFNTCFHSPNNKLVIAHSYIIISKDNLLNK